MNLDRENVIFNVECVHVETPSAAVAEGEVASEDAFPTSGQVFSESVGVSCDGTTALVKGQTVIATTQGSTVEIKTNNNKLKFVNGKTLYSHKLEKYDWCVRSLEKIVDILEESLEEHKEDGSQIMNEKFITGFFDDLKNTIPLFKDYYRHIY